MKQKQKSKIKTPIKAKKRLVLKSKTKVVLAHAKRPIVRHFRLIGHKYTFKLVHHRHTSHVGLVLVLALVGFFIYTSEGLVQAQTNSQSILVGAIVPGPAPSTGAAITSPSDGANLTGQNIINIKGSCQVNTFVIVRDNNLTIGSTNCTEAGVFSLQAQLQYGKNMLSAKNYDNLNQPGPDTPQITVNLTETNGLVETTKPVEIIPLSVLQVIPDNPSIITGVSKLSDCSDYNPGNLPTGGEPHVSIVCVPRLFLPGITHSLGLIVWGGQPPYALSINWGKESTDESTEQSIEKKEDTLLSLTAPGYKLVNFDYVVPDTYRVQVKVKDNNNQDAIIQTAIQVNGESTKTTTTTSTNIVNNILNDPWFKTPVPFYLLAVAITFGFWGGDLFDRKFGSKLKYHLKRRRTA